MPYLTLQGIVNSTSGSNPVVIVSTANGTTLVIDDLQAICNLTSGSVANFQGEVPRLVELSIRNTQSNLITTLLQFPIYRKQIAYSENLLSYLTFKQRFILEPFREIRLQLVAANGVLAGTDFISIIGQAATVDSVDTPAVVQNFITANYSMPNRDNLQALTLNPNWSVFDAARPPRYYKDQIGRVHITGFVKQATQTANDVISVLPVGFRPLEDLDFNVSGSAGFITVRTLTNGNLISFQASGAFLSLNGISFLAA